MPSTVALCAPCTEEVQRYAQLVAEGGVYWYCTVCDASGAIAPCPLTVELRDLEHLPAPTPLLVAFFKCQQHQGNPDETAL